MARKGKGGDAPTIVIRREEGGGHAHHGGAWKVAYADFVTAMMAFFLLMWLLNATSEEQRRGLADYFSPSNVLARAHSGSGAPFGGKTPNAEGTAASDAGALRVERGQAPVRLDIEEEGEEPPGPSAYGQGSPDARDADPAVPAPGGPLAAAGPGEDAPAAGRAAAPPSSAPPFSTPSAPPPAQPSAAPSPGEAAALLGRVPDAALRAEQARREREAFEQAAAELRAAVRDDPTLAELARQLLVEQVPQGLRIQLLDAERQPMFAVGGAAPNERARALLQKVAQVAARLPNGISIAGHTDATPFRGDQRSNWDLSADRANAVRRLLAENGIPASRIQGVSGVADREPLLPEDPAAAANRRVAITILRAAP